MYSTFISTFFLYFYPHSAARYSLIMTEASSFLYRCPKGKVIRRTCFLFRNIYCTGKPVIPIFLSPALFKQCVIQHQSLLAHYSALSAESDTLIALPRAINVSDSALSGVHTL